MDKTKNIVRMRQGVVLFITLSVIVAMMALVGVIFSYLDKSRENASHTAALIQADLIFRDSKVAIDTLLKKGSKDKKVKREILDILYLASVTIQAEENEAMFTTLDCQALDNGVDINWLGLEDNSSAQALYASAQITFDLLVDKYNIRDASRLLSLIKSAIGDAEESEEQNKGRLGQRKGIMSLSQFNIIARDYRFEVDDSKIEKILWEEYFSFDVQSSMIDGNYLSAEFIALFFEMELDIVREEWFEGDDLKAFISSFGGDESRYDEKLFSTEAIERMECQVIYGYQGIVYAMGFDYIEGRAEKFEFYGKQ